MELGHEARGPTPANMPHGFAHGPIEGGGILFSSLGGSHRPRRQGRPDHMSGLRPEGNPVHAIFWGLAPVDELPIPTLRSCGVMHVSRMRQAHSTWVSTFVDLNREAEATAPDSVERRAARLAIWAAQRASDEWVARQLTMRGPRDDVTETAVAEAENTPTTLRF